MNNHKASRRLKSRRNFIRTVSSPVASLCQGATDDVSKLEFIVEQIDWHSDSETDSLQPSYIVIHFFTCFSSEKTERVWYKESCSLKIIKRNNSEKQTKKQLVERWTYNLLWAERYSVSESPQKYTRCIVWSPTPLLLPPYVS